MNKKAYMFILDVTIAIVILLVAATLLYYKFTHITDPVYFTEQLSEDIVGVMSYTTLPDICIDLDSPGCNCPNYPKIEEISCNSKNKKVSILGMINEGIETGSIGDSEVKDVIRDIFVDKKIIDKNRFGFAVLYTKPKTGETLEIYNSEVDNP
jgi:hypothetical protein